MNAHLYGIFAQTVADGDAKPPGDLGGKLNDMVGYGKYVAFSICVLALIAAAVKMAMDNQRGHGGEGPGGVVKVLGAVAIISGAASLVGLFV